MEDKTNRVLANSDKIMKKVLTGVNKIYNDGDRENSNIDSDLVSSKRVLITNILTKELYKYSFLTPEELEAIEVGYIYVHDLSQRLDTINCCLFDIEHVLKNGFVMGNLRYTKPKTIATAFNILSDIVLSASSQQYGGFTLPELDKALSLFAELSFNKYLKEAKLLLWDSTGTQLQGSDQKVLYDYAEKKVKEDIRQGYQGLEYKFNSVSTSRGDYPFITITIGNDDNRFSRMICSEILDQHRIGQTVANGEKRPTLFPKIVFLNNGKNEEMLDKAVQCSSVAMYPDYLDVTENSPHRHQEAIVHPMGCRAFLSPYVDEKTGKHITTGRFNIGVVSFNLPLIYLEARKTKHSFYSLLDKYLEMARSIHIRTYEYLGKKKAKMNPIGFMYGGFYGGNLDRDDEIKPLLKSATASFGITALNELSFLRNNKSIKDAPYFAEEVMEYITQKVDEFKKEDGHLYAIYGTPAESLCGLQVEQIRKQFGIIPNVSDRNYITNSYHCHVSEDITCIQKLDAEAKFKKYFGGGNIQYTKFPVKYNVKSIKSIINYGMSKGLYQGVNLNLNYCNNCCTESDAAYIEKCNVCGSTDITSISRMNGYLSYSRVNGSSRLNEAKIDEIKERKSM